MCVCVCDHANIRKTFPLSTDASHIQPVISAMMCVCVCVCVCVTQAEYPAAYGESLTRLSKGDPIPVPRPHPKFSMSDMERIASQGPRFEDMVLSHAERVDDMSAAEYTYIPATVLGDWQFEQEPNWGETPQVGHTYTYIHTQRRAHTQGSLNRSRTGARRHRCGDYTHANTHTHTYVYTHRGVHTYRAV